MDIIVTELEPCKVSVQYVANAGEILEKRGQVLQAFKKAPTPGFRPGRSSIDAIKVHYKDQIEEALKRALAEDAYHNTLFEKKLKPHGAPRFNSIMMHDSKFTCEFEMFTKPDFELAAFKGLEIPKPHSKMTVSEFSEKLLQELRVKFGEVTPYSEDDQVQMGDNVIMDYECSLDGVKVNNLSAEGEMLTVGQSQLAAFDEQLIGMKLGETKEFDLVVPENGLPSLVGKTVRFKLTINMGSKTEPCPLDDSLAEKIGKKDFAELRDFVTSIATGRVANMDKVSLNEAVANRLVADNQVDVPPWMSISEAKYIAHSAKMDWDTLPDQDKERYLEIAVRNVKLSLILDKIRESEPEAQLTDQEVFNIIKQNLVKTVEKDKLDDTIKEWSRTGYLQIVMQRIKEEYCLDFAVKQMKVME